MASIEAVKPFIYIGVGAAFACLLSKLTKKPKKKKTKAKTKKRESSASFTETEVSDGESSSGYLSSVGDDVADLPTLVVPRLVASSFRKQTESAFDLLKSTLPDSIQVVPLRMFFALNSETFMPLSLLPDLSEPMMDGHPQTAYNTYMYPLKLILQSENVKCFCFEVVDARMKDPMATWTNKSYFEHNFKHEFDPSRLTHVVPLYVASEKDRAANPFLTKSLLVKHFAHSPRCMNVSPSKNSSSSSSASSSSEGKLKSTLPPVVLVVCFAV
ncbi:uncharacterized protein MONOS_16634 [Monocercomonoides exilis]|uniref:uncharacterized protein n=1 Tax=Monocercomonoides exilis TaxID=2049356 RepID=UPI003559C942|nr:hypothetical protein MONOS_16634 [Monocercomonoides exilis]|eukprot:MONOS_16634.1-p1 / transcript=MONOS_16634.1 / gene=MONOS_16634 / organism=Monocercomonoides_exilis_PA203 / gene_product=unspecified product / transcript_product=unspecified product / location=Mono_scaffold01952:1162-2212(+) / protein_length=271 / sequence_SO=supercontig / SO=protein_coding / is_pseudo=false